MESGDQPPEHKKAIEAGDVLGGRYIIQQILSESGAVGVYLAVHQHLESMVAVKVMFSRVTDDETMFLRFKREGSLAARLRHKNICQLQDFWIGEDGYPVMVMEFGSGPNLISVISGMKGNPDLTLIKSIIHQLLDALEYAHNVGIIHRDITPSNVMLEGQTVKLIDFGMAKSLYDTSSKVCMEGTIYGTPTFMSPERNTCVLLGNRTDLYSLGCVFHLVLTGRPPFRNENVVKLMRAHLHEEPDLQLEGIDASLIHIGAKLLEKDRDKRYQSAAEVREDLIRIESRPGNIV